MTHSLFPEKYHILSGSALKLIAILSMFIDHAALILARNADWMLVPFLSLAGRGITTYYLMRKIGRLAFPIFCFLIAEGMAHTHNQKRYALRLLFFALVSEIPFNLLISGQFFCSTSQNVYFTLLLGAVMIWIHENSKTSLSKALCMGTVAILTISLRTDYSLNGVLLILLMYLLRNQPAVQAILSYPLLSGGIFAFAAFLPINLYNGKRGFVQTPFWKFFFYAFYPLHILLLVLIGKLI